MLCPADDWQVRSFPLTDPRFAFLAPRGWWHLQLWHPDAGISVLTPSGLTRNDYEIFPILGWKRRAGRHEDLRGLLLAFHGIAPPSAGMLEGLQALFVRAPVEGLAERTAGAARGPQPGDGSPSPSLTEGRGR